MQRLSEDVPMLSVEEQLRFALNHIATELQLQNTEVEPGILRWERAADGVLHACLCISSAVFTWIQVQPDGQTMRLDFDSLTDSPPL